MNKYSSNSIILNRLKLMLSSRLFFQLTIVFSLIYWNWDIWTLKFNENRVTQLNQKKLLEFQKNIQQYEVNNGEIPESLLDLYQWCVKNRDICLSSKINPLDAQGKRIEFQRLDRKHYYLKTYSEIANKENPKRTDIKELHIKSKNLKFEINNIREPLSFKKNPTDMKSRTSIFRHIEGESKDGKWQVRIFADFTLGRRRLVIIENNPTKDSSTVILAPQLFIEEFSWVSDFGDFVFSAASDSTNDSGVYLWTSKDHKIKKIWPDSKELKSSNSSMNSMISYSKNSEVNLVSFVNADNFKNAKSCFFAKKNYMQAISPTDFFSIENLFCVYFDPESKHTKVEPVQETTALPNNFLNILTTSSSLDFNKTDLQGDENNEVEYKKWISLPIGPNLATTLEAWNEYTEMYAQSPIGPYSMWTLIRLYSEAIFEIEKSSPLKEEDESKVRQLRTLCLSLTKALAQHPLSPSYLNAFSAYIHEELARNSSLTYRWAPGIFR